jgi:uncharacterized protein YjbK
LFNKTSAAKAVAAQAFIKANRYTKQRRLTLKRIKKLGRRENQNILKLKVNEMLTNGTAVIKGLKMDKLIAIIIKGFILLGVLNSFSSRSFSFLNPTLLGSFNRSVKVL